MWIEETKNGKYKFVEQYTDYITGKKKRVSVTLEKKTAAAKKSAAAILVKMIEEKQSTLPEKENITFGELIDKYREYQKSAVKSSTYKRNYTAAEALKKIIGADTLVSRITANYIKDRFLKSGKENGTLNEHRTRLFAILHWAYENDYIETVDFLRKIKPFKEQSRKEKIQDKYLEPEEINTLLDGMQHKKWNLLTRFLLLSGLRVGEAIALENSDIDYKNHTIHVTKNYDILNKIVTSTKTLYSERDVYMQPELESICKDITMYTKIEALANGYRTQLFLCSKFGNYICYGSYNKYLRENSRKLLGKSVTAHALRHTHASILLAQGVNVETISRRLGHENSKITREIYLHVTEKLIERDNEQIKSVHII